MSMDRLLFDFLRDELERRVCADRFENNGVMMMEEMMEAAKAWINGEGNDQLFASVGDDADEGRWNKLEEEKEELVLDIESRVFHVLMDELLADLF